jgi:hypothetical protein
MLSQALPGFGLQATASKLADGYDITAILAQELLDLADQHYRLPRMTEAGELRCH